MKTRCGDQYCAGRLQQLLKKNLRQKYLTLQIAVMLKKTYYPIENQKRKLLRNYKESRIKKMASDLREKHAIAMPYFICYMLMLYSATTFLKMFTPFVLQVLFCFVLLCLKEL